MVRKSIVVSLVWLICVAGASAQPGPLDLIPQNATAAISIRNLKELLSRGDELVAETGLQLPARPSELVATVYQAIGIRDFVDYERPAAIVLFPPKNGLRAMGLQDLEENLLGIVPFTSADGVARRLGLTPGEIKPEQIFRGERGIFRQPFHGYVRDKYLYYSASRSAIERYLKAQPVRADLSAEQQKSLSKADIFVHLGVSTFGNEAAELQRDLERALPKDLDPQEAKTAREFIERVKDLRFSLITARVEKGLGISAVNVFDKQSEPTKNLLAGLRDGLRPSDLANLPEGRVVFAQSAAGEGAKNVVLARLFFSVMLKSFLETQEIFSPADRPSFVGVFAEVWQRLRGTRSALYLTSNEQKRGLFSMVGILDSEDPQAFLKTMRLLARMAEGTGLDLTPKTDDAEVDIAKLIKDLGASNFRVRSSATTRLRLIGEPALPYLEKTITKPPDLETQRRAEQLREQIGQVAAERRRELLAKDVPKRLHPSFVFHAKPETRRGHDVDIIQLRLEDKDLLAVASMRQLLGPDWDKIRIAVHGKQLVALVGSEVELLDTALDNLKNNRPGLAAVKTFSAFKQQSNPGRSVEFHAALSTLVSLTGTNKQLPPVGKIEALTSFSVTIEADRVQLDLWIPSADVRMIAKNTLGF